MALFKDIYSTDFFERFSNVMVAVMPGFDKKAFLKDIHTPEFAEKEYKDRFHHVTIALHQQLPGDFTKATHIIGLLVEELEKDSDNWDLIAFMFLPDYIEMYGMEDYNTSMQAFERITQYISCEFAVRPFIISYPEQMILQMIEWSYHPHPMVRRLASEGSRPRLPWAMALPAFKKDPSPILPILENLKNDPHESVRRSVANNLNDITKDNPEVVIDIATRWSGDNILTDKIVKHACRTLLKQAHPVILKLYGLDPENIKTEKFHILTKQVRIGGTLTFSFEITNDQDTEQIVRLEYAVYYMKANGKQAPKVFKISERTFKPFEKASITRNHPFKLITTRVFYPGEHRLSIIINGKEIAIDTFRLIE